MALSYASHLRTPDQVLGPFYPCKIDPAQGGDLTRPEGREGVAQGQIINLMGHVFGGQGAPVRGAKLVVWQANAFGRYSHPNDTNPAPLDPNFVGFAILHTDDHGCYRLKTIKPGSYPAGPAIIRPPHIHFEVFGTSERLITQMYFPGEPHNVTDPFLHSAVRPDALIARLEPPTPDMEPESKLALFDIVLLRG
jgi:protocatechuate 3,4-dioxygenase beta subunit